MYIITAYFRESGGYTIPVHDPSQDCYVVGAKLTQELNAVPSLRFEIDATNQMYEEVGAMIMSADKYIGVSEDGEDVFVGRVLDVNYNRLASTATVTCEGFLGVLNDYVIDPYAYTGSPRGYIQGLVDNAFNANPGAEPPLAVGTVDVVDPNDNIVRASETHVNLWDEVRSKTFGSSLGGYISATLAYSSGFVSSISINWKTAPSDVAQADAQTVEFRENMMECSDIVSGDDLFSGVYPVGAETSSATTTGRSWVLLDEDGSYDGDYEREGRSVFRRDLVARYGYIVKHVSWPNITLKANLLTAAKSLLDEQGTYGNISTMSCRAIDMVDAGEDVSRFQIGQPTTIVYPFNGTTRTASLYLTKMSVDLMDPGKSEFEFGRLQSSISSASSSSSEGGGYAGDTDYSHAEGYMTTASGFASHSKGVYALASGFASDATGGATTDDEPPTADYYAVASGSGSHAEGYFAHASGIGAHAEGFGYEDSAYAYGIYCNRATGDGAHAEGIASNATADGAHAEGCGYVFTGGVIGAKAQRATAEGAHAEGRATHALHAGSHAEGIQTETGCAAQHVGGRYNVVETDAAVVIGNGSESGTEGQGTITRSNCLVLDWDGNLDVSGGYYVNGQPISGGGTKTTWYGTSSTSSATVEKAVTCSGFTLASGAIIAVLFTTANTASTPTLNVNSTGAKSIYVGNAAPTSTTNVLRWSANTVVQFVYDGTYWRYLGGIAAGNVRQPMGAACWYGASSTASTTAAKTSTIANFRLTAGAFVAITFSNASTVEGALTLNVNSTGAKAIYVGSSATSASNPLTWEAGSTLTFAYDGAYWRHVATNAGYTLPAATASTLGGVKVGSGLAVASDGTLSATGGGGSGGVTTATFDITVESTASGNNSTNTVDVTNGTLTPIGIVGGQWVSGTRQNFMNLWQSYISGTTATIRFCNMHASSAANGVYRITVAYSA